ncbi:hypothetical protein P7C70_g8508, partial [Phenoliferia sp. Uapishka_3]
PSLLSGLTEIQAQMNNMIQSTEEELLEHKSFVDDVRTTIEGMLGVLGLSLDADKGVGEQLTSIVGRMEGWAEGKKLRDEAANAEREALAKTVAEKTTELEGKSQELLAVQGNLERTNSQVSEVKSWLSRAGSLTLLNTPSS